MNAASRMNCAPVILGDWGTSRLRLSLLVAGHVQAEIDGAGIGQLRTSPMEALLAAVAPWRQHAQRIVLCGMAGSRNGIVEVPYLRTPVDLSQWQQHQTKVAEGELDICISPGVSTLSPADVPDVIRGEETQVFGALCRQRELRSGRHLMVLPGTHSKWVQIEDGRIVAFNTYMTGELFALLVEHSTLLRAGGDPEATAAGFAFGLQRSREGNGRLAGALFETRSAQLMKGRSQGWAKEFLSGLLIGDEVQSALHIQPERDSICLIGDPRLTARYRLALEGMRHPVIELDGNRSAVEGLIQLAYGDLEAIFK